MKVYEKYIDSGVEWLGEIPEHWEPRLIKSIYENKSDKNQPDAIVLSVYRDFGVIPKDSRDDNHNVTSLDTSSYKYVKLGDLVVNKMKAWQGSMGISRYEGIVSPAYITCKPAHSGLDSQFNHYLLRSNSYIGEYNRLSYGVRIGQWDMHYEDFKNIAVFLPPLPEQIAIANFLDEKCEKIDRAIAQKEKQIELLKERKQILIQNAVTKGLDPQVKMRDSGVEWIGMIPEHWDVKKLKHFAKIGNGSTPNRTNMRYWNNGNFPWLNSSMVNHENITNANQFITENALRECHLPIIKPMTLLMAITGEGKTRGLVAICRIKATINQHLAYIDIQDRTILPEYIHRYLQSIYRNIREDSSSNGSTKGAITCSAIEKIRIPIPAIEEQRRIIEFIHKNILNADKVITQQQSQIEKLKEYKATLINSAVTGKIKVV